MIARSLETVLMGLVIAFGWGGPLYAETVTAPLNGTVSFGTASAAADTLRVNAGSHTVEANNATKVQGHPNSHITVVGSEGSGVVHVADVILREGESLYRVSGTLKTEGEGEGPPPTWTSEYNRGQARILLEVNGLGGADNKIKLGPDGANLTVKIAGGGDGTSYEVTLGFNGVGEVGFGTNPVTVSGGSGSATVVLTGVMVGELEITGTATNAQDGAVDAEVIGFLVEIQANDTEAANDDYVQIKSTHPAKRFEVNCRARLTGDLPAEDQEVVLVSPDGRLRFPTAATTQLSMPKSGDWVSFKISGESGSAALNDALISARQGGNDGAELGTQDVTVFWFDQASMTVTRGGTYGFGGGFYTVPLNPPAVSYKASARIRPQGVDCNAPQVTSLRVGIMQDIWTPGVTATTVYTNPKMNWAAGVPAGTPIGLHSSLTYSAGFAPTVSIPVNDGEPGAHPLYTQRAVALTRPHGCMGAVDAISNDTPRHPAPAVYSISIVGPGGNELGTAEYTLANATRTLEFRAYTVVYNTSTEDFSALREAQWSLDLDHVAGKNKATVKADAQAGRTPSTGPQANSVAKTQVTNASPGSIIVPFVAP
ncbi:MAG: hypothetical protein AAGF10_00105 [Verrucomicrobiota bacterium]